MRKLIKQPLFSTQCSWEIQLIKMEKLDNPAAPKVITPFMNMRYRSQDILRQVSALLITLSDNTFHITEHILFQVMWEREARENINVRRNRNACEPQHMFLRAIKVIWLGKLVSAMIRNYKSIYSMEELKHVLSIDDMAWKSKQLWNSHFLGTIIRLSISHSCFHAFGKFLCARSILILWILW